MTTWSPFELDGALPRQATIVEASAGTGKTYAIVGLVARYVASGLGLEDLLVVTFTRAATAELRTRVRARLEETLRIVETVPDTPQRHLMPEYDEVVTAILRDEVPSEAADRLRVALSDVDGAAITTIHSFCQHALDGLGLAVGLDREAELSDQDHELVAGVVDDLLVRRYAGLVDDAEIPSYAEALRIGLAAINQPHAQILPEGPLDCDRDGKVIELHWLAHEVREELGRRKAAGRWLNYDDLLTRLRDAIRDPHHGEEVVRSLRTRHPVVLVDEFQDTDPVQWDILRLAFSDTPLTLVGDPKQAIYSFRGADVDAYLDAVHHVGEPGMRTLTTNRRSDVRLLDAFNRLLEGATLGGDIAYRRVQAPDEAAPPRLVGAKPDAPLRLRLLRRDMPQLPPEPAVAQLRDVVARDLAGELTTLLTQGAQILDDDGAERDVVPGDVAVLVRTNDQAARVQQALLDAGVPAVINGAGSVFETVAASEWLWLLSALDAPHDEGRARAAALTSLLGWSAEELDTAGEQRWQHLHDLLHDLSAHLRATSPAALWRALRARCRVGERLLARAGGERRLTDLAHVADLLHTEATRGGRGARDLSSWLREQMARDEQGVAPDERARRLESDADAVQVVTVHRSKGLEFPIVYCPYLWSSSGVWQSPWVGRLGDRRVLHVGSGDQADEVREIERRENREEELRLLYVALTRARHQVVLWWAPCRGTQYSPLSRVLFCRRGGTGEAMTSCQQGHPPKDDEQVLDRLHRTFGEADALISIESVARPTEPVAVARTETAEAPLEAAEIDARRVDRSWRRTSYTALTSRAHRPSTEREATVTNDEELDDAVLGGAGAGSTGADYGHGSSPAHEALLRGTALPLGALPGGTRFGTYVHALFEQLDFTAPDPVAALAEVAGELHARSPLDEAASQTLHAGLADVLATPLGPIADDLALGDVERTDRLDELAFELPLAGGDAAAQVSVRGIAALVRRYADEDPLLDAYMPALSDDSSFGAGVRGYLTGSLDLTLRVCGSRFLVVDYKTNQLTSWEAEPSAWDYRPEALVSAMCRGHYPLQALLYLVALHRYLRWRVRGYDPSRHLGGAAYLFVRGMVGADTPRQPDGPWAGTPTGVMPWCPDPGLIEDVSALLQTGEEQ